MQTAKLMFRTTKLTFHRESFAEEPISEVCETTLKRNKNTMPCCECWNTPHYQWINRYDHTGVCVTVLSSFCAGNSPSCVYAGSFCCLSLHSWILLGLTVLSWVLSVVTMAACEFYRIQSANNKADGIGIFSFENGYSGCQNYKGSNIELDGPLRTAKMFAVLGNLALIAAFRFLIMAMFVLKDKEEARTNWVVSRGFHCIALFCVFMTFSIRRSKVKEDLADDLSMGTAGAANVVNIFFLFGTIITSFFVPGPDRPFSGFGDCGCFELPTVVTRTDSSTTSANNSMETTEHTSSTDSSSPAGRSRTDPKSIRQRRLESKQVKILYHQTDEASAKRIEKDGKMRRGSSGLVGGGIYFTDSQSTTHPKAQRKGYMVIAKVKLGNVKNIGLSGDSTITFQSLLAQGYDSVKVTRSSGTEYVVYNWDQAEVIDVTKM